MSWELYRRLEIVFFFPFPLIFFFSSFKSHAFLLFRHVLPIFFFIYLSRKVSGAWRIIAVTDGGRLLVCEHTRPPLTREVDARYIVVLVRELLLRCQTRKERKNKQKNKDGHCGLLPRNDRNSKTVQLRWHLDVRCRSRLYNVFVFKLLLLLGPSMPNEAYYTMYVIYYKE